MLTGCATSPEAVAPSPNSSRIVATELDHEACEKWADDLSNIQILMSETTEADWNAGEGERLHNLLANQELASSELAEDRELKQLLLDLSTVDRTIANDLSAGTYTEPLDVVDADIYERCYELGIQTEPKNPDGTSANFYVSKEPVLQPNGVLIISEPELQVARDNSLEAVQKAYKDCFPAVAAGKTVSEFDFRPASSSSAPIEKSYTPLGENTREGIVSVTAGINKLKFDTRVYLSGIVKIKPADSQTKSILDSSECFQQDY